MADDVVVRPPDRTGGRGNRGGFVELTSTRSSGASANTLQDMPSLRPLSFLFGSKQKEDVISQYVIREHHRGRSLEEILVDPRVTNSLTPEQINALLDRPELVHAVGEDLIAAHRTAG